MNIATVLFNLACASIKINSFIVNYISMKKTLMLFVLFISAAVSAQQYEYKIFTVVESVVPNGLDVLV